MADADIALKGLARAMARFPDASATLRGLASTDPEFHAICEEYALAQDSLAGFEARLDAASRTEIDEYRRVIVEIEGEIERYLGPKPRG